MKKYLILVVIIVSAVFVTPAQTPKPAAQGGGSPSQPPASVGCGCEGEPLPEVVAVVNGVQITKQDMEAQTRIQIDELQKSVIEARQRELDLQINSRLLEAEAKKRGKTTAKLLEEEIVAKVADPTAAEAQTFYNQNQSRINQPFADVRADIISYLRDMRQREESKKFADKLRATAAVKILTPNPAPPASEAERARVLAVVNGEQITSAKIEDSLKPLIYSVQERTYQLRKNLVELRINDVLLEQEAQKRKITTRALLDAEVAAKSKPVTEAEAQVFYQQNKERINGEFAALKGQIIQYLQETQAQTLQAAFAEQLRKGATLQINLRAPEPPVLKIATDDQPSKGNPNALVTMVEFTDFQCPSCAAAQPVIEKLLAEYGDRLRLVVRDYPLGQHENAFKAAEAAEAARAQEKYWEYANLLFTNQSALGIDKLKEYATRAGLDRKTFDALLDSGQMAEKVQRDLTDGNLAGVSSTPSFFINGQIVKGTSYEVLKAAIEKALSGKSKSSLR